MFFQIYRACRWQARIPTNLYRIKDTLNEGTYKKLICKHIDPDEVAHNEPPHLDLQCLSSSLWILSMIYLRRSMFLKFCRRKFCRLLFLALFTSRLVEYGTQLWRTWCPKTIRRFHVFHFLWSWSSFNYVLQRILPLKQRHIICVEIICKHVTFTIF